MALLINLIAVLVWPGVVIAIGHYLIKYLDEILKLRKPLSDRYYMELKEELKTLRSEINSHRIRQGYEE